MEGQISVALQEKETLLREIHHRAKNNLQVISSMFNLQSALIIDPAMKGAFQVCQDHIETIAMVHEQLYQTEGLQRINFAKYIDMMLDRLQRNFTDYQLTMSTEMEMADVYLSIDMATPCGLIAYELVSNAHKHAFTAGMEGIITVGLKCEEDNFCALTIRDNGIGLPEHVDQQDGGKLGLKLVRALVSQIGGRLNIQHQPGTCVEITFPIDGDSR